MLGEALDGAAGRLVIGDRRSDVRNPDRLVHPAGAGIADRLGTAPTDALRGPVVLLRDEQAVLAIARVFASVRQVVGDGVLDRVEPQRVLAAPDRARSELDDR